MSVVSVVITPKLKALVSEESEQSSIFHSFHTLAIRNAHKVTFATCLQILLFASFAQSLTFFPSKKAH